jgi:hypothetical protein
MLLAHWVKVVVVKVLESQHLTNQVLPQLPHLQQQLPHLRRHLCNL